MRAIRTAVAAWYLLSAISALPVLIDRFAPQTKTIAAADFPCAHHDCACRTAEHCHRHCCCFPKHRTAQAPTRPAVPHVEGPRTVRVSLRAIAACSGGTLPDGLSPHLARLGPHLPVGVQPLTTPEPVRRLRAGAPRLRHSAPVDIPEPVPRPA